MGLNVMLHSYCQSGAFCWKYSFQMLSAPSRWDMCHHNTVIRTHNDTGYKKTTIVPCKIVHNEWIEKHYCSKVFFPTAYLGIQPVSIVVQDEDSLDSVQGWLLWVDSIFMNGFILIHTKVKRNPAGNVCCCLVLKIKQCFKHCFLLIFI